jgi:hypothetical protein
MASLRGICVGVAFGCESVSKDLSNSLVRLAQKLSCLNPSSDERKVAAEYPNILSRADDAKSKESETRPLY